MSVAEEGVGRPSGSQRRTADCRSRSVRRCHRWPCFTLTHPSPHRQDTGTRRRQQIAVADGALALATAETLVQNLTHRANATEFRLVLPKAVVRGWRLTNAPFGL